jgi:predicted acylesterase/phospholipase RssA/CRP-like cAMP-binding protein
MLSEISRSYLSTIPLFHHLGADALADLVSELEFVSLSGGEILFRSGDDGDALYVVLSGRLRIIAERSDGTGEVLREAARGEVVGELALLTGKPRSATVRAIRDSELAKLSRAAFENALARHPRMMSHLAMQIAERQSETSRDSQPARNVRTLAILPFDENAPAADFVRALVGVLQSAGSTLHLNRSAVESLHPAVLAEAGGNGAATAYLNSFETEYRFVVYEADVELTSWTERCIRQADLILIVAAADREPSSAKLQALAGYFARRNVAAGIELAFLHPGGFAPQVRADRWLSSLRVENYHHLIHRSPADAERLLRFLTGTAVGLVLSGGGARGFAHIGVIRAMNECAVPIDYIGGTSMGAVIAAQYALGWDWQKMLEVNRVAWPRCEPQRNFTLPLVALNSARRMDQMLGEMFGRAEIENLRGKFFCVSTNLTRAEAMVHRSGLLWKAVRASMSIPGIGPPAIEGGEIFVDGGLVNNLPVDVMKRFCPGAVIAVDVSEQVEFKSALQESYSLSGWRLLWQRLNPLRPKSDIPNILNILYRATTVGGVGAVESARALADLCIEPPVKDFGIFDWRRVEAIAEIGYRHALAQLEGGVHRRGGAQSAK